MHGIGVSVLDVQSAYESERYTFDPPTADGIVGRSPDGLVLLRCKGNEANLSQIEVRVSMDYLQWRRAVALVVVSQTMVLYRVPRDDTVPAAD